MLSLSRCSSFSDEAKVWSNLLTFLPDPPPPPRANSPSRTSRYAKNPTLLSLPSRSGSKGATQRAATVLPPLRIDTSLVAQHGAPPTSARYHHQKGSHVPEEEANFMKRLARATAQRRQQLLTPWTRTHQPSSPSLPTLASPQKLEPLRSPARASNDRIRLPQTSPHPPQKPQSVRSPGYDGIESPRYYSNRQAPVPPTRSMPTSATHRAKSAWLKSPIITEDMVAGPSSSEQTSVQRAQAIAATCEQLKKWLIQKAPPAKHDVVSPDRPEALSRDVEEDVHRRFANGRTYRVAKAAAVELPETSIVMRPVPPPRTKRSLAPRPPPIQTQADVTFVTAVPREGLQTNKMLRNGNRLPDAQVPYHRAQRSSPVSYLLAFATLPPETKTREQKIALPTPALDVPSSRAVNFFLMAERLVHHPKMTIEQIHRMLAKNRYQHPARAVATKALRAVPPAPRTSANVPSTPAKCRPAFAVTRHPMTRVPKEETKAHTHKAGLKPQSTGTAQLRPFKSASLNHQTTQEVAPIASSYQTHVEGPRHLDSGSESLLRAQLSALDAQLRHKILNKVHRAVL